MQNEIKNSEALLPPRVLSAPPPYPSGDPVITPSLSNHTRFSTRRIALALAIAGISDLISAFANFAPPIEWPVDLATALLLFMALGWHWILLPALIMEAIPGVGAFPFWVLVIMSIAVWGKVKREPKNVRGRVPEGSNHYIHGCIALFTLCSSPLSPSVFASAQEWSQWRGPNRDGESTETGLLKEWPANGPALLWKSKALGGGYGSISSSGGRLFAMGEKDGAGFLMALKQPNGELLWTTKVGKAGAPGWGGFSGPRGTPTVAGERVYAADQWGELICVDAATGKEQWRKSYETDFSAKRPEWGFAESPLVDANRVIVTPGGSQGALVALDLKTGTTLWRSKSFTDDAQYSSAVVAVIGNARQYIQLTMESLVGVAAEDGRVLWQTRRKGSTAVIPDPIVAGDQVYVTSGYGTGCNLFKVSRGSAFSVKQEYANKIMVNHHGGVVKVGDYLYGYSDGKGWMCQKFQTGEEIWAEKARLKKGSICYADGMLYCREEADKSKTAKGTVALLEATPAGFREKGRFDPPDRSDMNSWSHPVIADGKLYLRDQEVLLCYDIQAK